MDTYRDIEVFRKGKFRQREMQRLKRGDIFRYADTPHQVFEVVTRAQNIPDSDGIYRRNVRVQARDAQTVPKFFLPITRIDEEERMVYGYGTREDIKDSYGTIIDLDSVKKCIPDYAKWRNIREMHQCSAVGTADDITVDDKGVFLGAKVVDDIAWTKVKAGVYKGFSVGGKKDYQDGDRIFLKGITEFSLVDRPSNEGCTIDEYRINQISEKEEENTIMPDTKRKEFDSKQREKDADKDKALPDGSYPIENKEDLKNAIKAYGRAKDKEAAKAHIKKRAKDLGAEDLLPEDWTSGKSKDEEEKGKEKDKSKTEKSDMPNVKRYLGEEAWDARVALECLDCLISLLSKEQTEEHAEASAQVADLILVIQKLKAFIASEILENDPATTTTESLPVTTLMAAGEEDDITRKGASISASNLERIQAMHDHSTALGARCQREDTAECEKTDTPDLTRARVQADVVRLTEDVNNLTQKLSEKDKEIKRLKAEPADTKSTTRVVVGKDDDGKSVEQLEAEEAEIKRIAALPLDKQAVELVKRAQKNPQFLRI